MSTNSLSEETETKLIDFFNNSIDPKSMAKTIRQLNYIIALGIMKEHETLKLEIIKIENGFYWLNQLAEVLHPYLEVE